MSSKTTVTGPTFGDMPHLPTIWRAIAVACRRSDSAPVVITPYTTASAAMPPRAPTIRPRRYSSS